MAWRQPQGLVPVQNEGKGVEASKSGVNQNENLPILKGKAADGAKSDIIQEENLHLLRGEVVEGFKAEIPKPAKDGRQCRKALADLSQARKPVLPAASKAKAPKDKSTAKKAQKSNIILTDEQQKKCREWAKDGIEHMHFTYSDMRELEDQQKEQRVWEQVALALCGLREWTDMTFGLEIPVEEDPSDTEDTLQLKFLPEVLPPASPSSPPTTPRWARWSKSLLEADLFMAHDWQENHDVPIRLKEEYEDDDVCLHP